MSVYLKCKAGSSKLSYEGKTTAEKPYLAMNYTTQTGTNSSQTTISKAYIPLTTDTAAVTEKDLRIKVTTQDSNNPAATTYTTLYALGKIVDTVTLTLWSMTSSRSYGRQTRSYSVTSQFTLSSYRTGNSGAGAYSINYTINNIGPNERCLWSAHLPVNTASTIDLGQSTFSIYCTMTKLRTDANPFPYCDTTYIVDNGLNTFKSIASSQDTITILSSILSSTSEQSTVNGKIVIGRSDYCTREDIYKYFATLITSYSNSSSSSNNTYSNSYTITTTVLPD